MKFAIITSICGSREKLANPSIVFENADYFAFVDEPCNDGGTIWEQKNNFHFSNDARFSHRRNAKIFKIMPELFISGYDVYFWVDASHELVRNPQHVYDEYLTNSDYAMFKHRERDCAYDESEIVKQLKYDHEELITSEMEYFRSIGFPRNNGLFELSAFVKKRNHKTTLASIKWWEYICKYSSRDQLSFPMVKWECDLSVSVLPGGANGINSKGSIGNNDIMPQTRVHVGSGQ